MASNDDVQEWERRNGPLFRRTITCYSGGRSGTANVIHPEISHTDFMRRQRYYETACQQCNIEAMYASVPSDVIDNPKDKEAWIQNSIDQQRRIVAKIRSQPWSMAKKKEALGLARQFIDDYEPNIAMIPSQFEISYPVTKSLWSWHSFFNNIIWGERIRRITGMFGSGVASYFKFLRWLCFLNLMLTIFIFSFICLPQLIYNDEGLDAPTNYSYPISLVVDGRGIDFEYSILFIGYYSNGRTGGNGSTNELGSSYKLPIAYLVVMFWAFLISICFILFSMSEKHAVLERIRVQDVYPFSWRVFFTWDFSVTSRSGVITKHKVVIRELKELVDEILSKSDKNKYALYLLRFLVALLVVLMYIGSGVAIYFTVDWTTDCPSVENRNDNDDYCYQVNGALEDSNLREFVNFLLAFRLATVVSLLNICLSWVMLAVVKIESWTPRNENIVSTIRIYVLYLFNLGVLTYSLYTLSQNCGEDCCWETVIGQQLYRLVCFELFAEFVSVLVADVMRSLVVRSGKIKVFSDWVDYPRFNLPKNVANLIYGQALVWLGMFFCPLLPFIGLLKDFVLFYMRGWAVRVFNNAPKHLYRAEATINYYFTLLLLLVIAIMFPVGWAVTRLSPSGVCGPFRGKEFMINAIEDEIDYWANSSSDSLRRFGEFVLGLQTSAVVIPIFIILCIIAYYFYACASSLKEVKKDLIIQLDVEKQKLQSRIARDEMRQRQYSHVVARDAKYKESPPDQNRQKLLATPKDGYTHWQSNTPSSENQSTQHDVHSAHEAMINDLMV